MSIVAINTVRIFLNDSAAQSRETLQELTLELKDAPGCLGYALTPDMQDERRWILTGHWANQADMLKHFSSPRLEKTLNSLMALSAHLHFASFCLSPPAPAKAAT